MQATATTNYSYNNTGTYVTAEIRRRLGMYGGFVFGEWGDRHCIKCPMTYKNTY